VAETSAAAQLDASIIWEAFEKAPAEKWDKPHTIWSYTTADPTAFEEAVELAVA
jgi:hypothetical protein